MVEQSGRDVAEKAMSAAPVVVQFALATGGWDCEVRRIILQQLLCRLLDLRLTVTET